MLFYTEWIALLICSDLAAPRRLLFYKPSLNLFSYFIELCHAKMNSNYQFCLFQQRLLFILLAV